MRPSYPKPLTCIAIIDEHTVTIRSIITGKPLFTMGHKHNCRRDYCFLSTQEFLTIRDQLENEAEHLNMTG